MNHPRRERSREYLAPDEVQKLLDASRKEGLSRNRERDYCLLLLMFRHGLRVSEACQLKVTDVNVKEKIIHIHRLKNGNATTQPMYNGEVGAVNAWLKARHQMQPHSNHWIVLNMRPGAGGGITFRPRRECSSGSIRSARGSAENSYQRDSRNPCPSDAFALCWPSSG